MATVTPPSNLGFTPSLTVDLTGGVYSTSYDSADYDVARSVTYYVDPEEGSDSNNGTSWGTAFATLTKAITEANAQTSAEINLRPGTGYTAGWGTTAISKPVTIQGVGGKAIISNGRGGKDFSVTTAPVYRRTGHAITSCYDFSKLDSDGAPQSLTLVADIATVTSTPGSFTIDSGNCYVHLEDGRAPDSDFCTAGGSVAFCQLASGATSVYLKDVITVGSPTRHLTAIQDTSVVEVVCEDCEWHYCKGTTTDSIQIDARGLFIFKNNLITNGDKDGFNYRPGTTPDGEFWEIDCTVIKCGIVGVDACNCSTGHETCYIVRVNGTYKEARHRAIHDIGDGTRSWNINCSAQAGTVTDSYVPGAWCSGIPDDTTKVFLEACTASGDEAHFLPLGSSSEIIMRNMSPLPNTGGELAVENIAARVLAAMNADPPNVVADSLSATAQASIVAAIDADPPSVNVVEVNGTATSLLSEPIDANVTEVLGSAPTLLSDPLEVDLSAVALAEVASASVTITPLSSRLGDRAGKNYYLAYTSETNSIAVTVFDSGGNAVDLSAKTLGVYWETTAKVSVASLTSGITVTGVGNNVVNFAIPSAVTSEERELIFAIRDQAAPQALYAGGVFDVEYLPSGS